MNSKLVEVMEPKIMILLGSASDFAIAEKAIDILWMEDKDGHVDSELLNVFIDAKVFARIDELRAVEKR